jgi:hypothetical protein
MFNAHGDAAGPEIAEDLIAHLAGCWEVSREEALDRLGDQLIDSFFRSPSRLARALRPERETRRTEATRQSA